MSAGKAPISGSDRARLQRAALERLLAEEGLAGSARTIPSRADRTSAPASHSQELLWLLDQSTPDLTAYNGPVARRLRGPVDPAALERALDLLVRRHDVLRTTFHSGAEGPIQRVEPPAPFRLLVEDLSAPPDGEREAALATRMAAEARRRFELQTDLLLRATLYRLGESEWVLQLVSHHIVMDGWSLGVLFRELSALYAALRCGTSLELPALPISFGDYAAWQRSAATGAAREADLAYWRDVLSGTLPVLELPTDRPRPVTHGFAGNTARRVIARGVLEELKGLAQAGGASLYMVLVAAYQSLLSRWTGQDDIIIGSPAAGRPARETEGLVGYFNNPLVIRTRFGDDPTFGELVARVRETCLGAFEHQELPFEALALELTKAERPSHAPLFRAVLTMQETHAKDLELQGVAVSAVPVEHGSVKFDFTLLTSEHQDGLHFDLEYRTDLFETATAERFLGHLDTMLGAIAADPSQRISALPVLTPAERSQLTAWNATDRDLGVPATMTALLIGAARGRGDQIAVRSGGAALTWDELMTRASRLAHRLQALGAEPETTVGLCVERSADLIVGMAGILLSGAAYVPLLPDQPAARIKEQLEGSGARWVVTLEAHKALLQGAVGRICLDADSEALAAEPATPPPCAASPASPAYVLFTSGSTGTPKGVSVTHGNLVHYTRAIASRLGLDLDGRSAAWHFGSVSTLAADLGHTAVFPALASGGTLHLLPADVVMDATRYQRYATEHRLDLLKITPSHWQALAGPEFAPEYLPTRWLVLGGEACPWAVAEAVSARGGCRVLNHYGPTETTVGATTFEPGSRIIAGVVAGTVPIGRPLPNVTAQVLDQWGRALPVGIPGELWLGGQGVARGYVGRDDLTRERFADRGESRRYRTGDLVRRLPTGDIEFLGRLDTQVKIRGHRVELGEIEAALGSDPAVRQAVVSLVAEVLVGYVVAAADATDEALSRRLAERLPDYMVPSRYVRMERLPLTANGKVDRAALPAPAIAGASDEAGGAPRGETEQKLAALWAEVLKKESVERDANFFALGGHSLLAIRLLGKVAQTFGPRLALRTLFERPTVAALAEVLAPSHPMEAPLAVLWAEVLKRDRVGRDENFFALGGHSLLAIRLLGRIAKQFGVRLSLRTLFEAPTIGVLAPLIEAAGGKAGPGT